MSIELTIRRCGKCGSVEEFEGCPKDADFCQIEEVEVIPVSDHQDALGEAEGFRDECESQFQAAVEREGAEIARRQQAETRLEELREGLERLEMSSETHTDEAVLILEPMTLSLGRGGVDWLDAHPKERACLEQFVAMMVEELAANDGKGNRPGWLRMDRKEALAEVHWHAAKLAVRAKDVSGIAEDEGPDIASSSEDAEEVREYAADVANCALMVLDCMNLLPVSVPR